MPSRPRRRRAPVVPAYVGVAAARFNRPAPRPLHWPLRRHAGCRGAI